MLEQSLIEQAKRVSLLDLIGADTHLRKVASTAGGEYAGPCPFCGGRDRLRVQPERGLWWCRQCGGEHWQDAIGYVKKRDRVEFAEAVERLIGGTVSPRFQAARPLDKAQVHAKPPSAVWQANAHEIIRQAEAALWRDAGAKARDWLHQRGLNDDSLRRWHIGYNPTSREVSGLYVQHGIVIPCEIDGAIWYLKVRRPTGEPKYVQVKGGQSALFGADTLGAGDYAVLAEGEFDAMLTWQILQHATNAEWHKVGVATLGSAIVPNSFVATWSRYLLPVSRFLVCYDMDQAGDRGADTWSAITARAVRVSIPKIKPEDKDLTDFHCSGGRILDLITYEIARDRYMRNQLEQSVVRPSHPVQSTDSTQPQDGLADLRGQRDAIIAAWNETLEELERMDQETPEFEELFAAWQAIDNEYKKLDDWIAALEIDERQQQWNAGHASPSRNLIGADNA